MPKPIHGSRNCLFADACQGSHIDKIFPLAIQNPLDFPFGFRPPLAIGLESAHICLLGKPIKAPLRKIRLPAMAD